MGKLLVVAAGIAMAFCACEKNKDMTSASNAPCPLNQTTILGTYKITTLQYFNPGSSTAVDSLSRLPACERDNVYVLNPNNSYEYKDVGTICTTTTGGVGTWSLGDQTFVLDRKVGKIKNFDCNNLTILEDDVKTTGDRLRTVYTRQ